MPATRDQQRRVAKLITRLGGAAVRGDLLGIVRILGGLSNILSMLTGRRSLPRGVSQKDIEAAVAVFGDAGLMRGVKTNVRLPRGQVSTAAEFGDDDDIMPPAMEPGVQGTTADIGRPGARAVSAFRTTDVFSNEIQTPQSSNVYSFAYDKEEGSLFVTFKAAGKKDSRGHRPHVRGAMYVYGGKLRPVPPVVYGDMVHRSSKGGVVWDRLRVRGTIWGHQYPYRLVTGDLNHPGFQDRREPYVPRKATRKGFAVRTVAVVPGFRRGHHVTSTLPARRRQ